MEEKQVFLIGSNGIPAKYGGFETFVEKLTAKRINTKIKYHVACMGKDNHEEEYNSARCFYVKVPNIGPAKAIYYDLISLKRAIQYIKKNKLKNVTIYLLGSTIGTFTGFFKRTLEKNNIKLYVNPDGCEWKRDKWNYFVKKYLKLSEKCMVKNANLVICDSIHIETYIQEQYKKYHPNTTFIAYGSDVQEKNTNKESKKQEENMKIENKKTENAEEKNINQKNIEKISDNQNLQNWYEEKKIKPNEYYLIVGRFVPENNYETMIKEFIKSNTQKDLVIITNVEQNKFYETLKQKTNFDSDKRIKFVGTVYNTDLLTQIRQNAYAYLHGHEVGGTNPSLLEALATTKLNLLLEVGFNQEVAKDSSLYWKKEEGNLSNLINKIDVMEEKEREQYGIKAKNRIKESYSWEHIVTQYEKIF